MQTNHPTELNSAAHFKLYLDSLFGLVNFDGLYGYDNGADARILVLHTFVISSVPAPLPLTSSCRQTMQDLTALSLCPRRGEFPRTTELHPASDRDSPE